MTLQTLAQDLGVSRATVSNAYNRPDQLSPALRARILARAAQLGFSGPDPVARGLRRGRVGAVGVLVDQSLSYAFSDPVAVLVLDGLAQELQQEGYGLLLHSAAPDQQDADAVRAAAVDGWVVLSVPTGHPAVLAAKACGRPLVVLDQPDLPGVPAVTVDDADGARQAAEHLVGLGHVRVAVLTPPLRGDVTGGFADAERLGVATHRVMAQRIAAARPVLAAAAANPPAAAATPAASPPAADTPAASPPAAVPVVECTANDEDAGAAGAALALDGPQRPTAVFALSDQLALGALRLARERGLAVPDELSVVGFDDAPPARRTDPALTTVAQPLRERGALLGRLLRAQLAGEPVEAPPAFPVRLVVRSSTGPPAASS